MNRPLWIVAAAVLGFASIAAHADGDGHRRAPPALYVQECGACHAPFPARGLGAAAWRDLIDGLPRHFGTDASLDAAATARIREHLLAGASSRRGDERPPELRMTRSAWFVREHREVPASAWQRPAVQSATRCAACHAAAEQGVFDEHDVRIPR